MLCCTCLTLNLQRIAKQFTWFLCLCNITEGNVWCSPCDTCQVSDICLNHSSQVLSTHFALKSYVSCLYTPQWLIMITPKTSYKPAKFKSRVVISCCFNLAVASSRSRVYNFKETLCGATAIHGVLLLLLLKVPTCELVNENIKDCLPQKEDKWCEEGHLSYTREDTKYSV